MYNLSMSNDKQFTAGSPLKEFISSAINQIKDSLPNDARIEGVVNIEMSTIYEKEKGGVIRISVLQAGAKTSEQNVHKITVPVKILSDVDKAKDEADIAEAEKRKRKANAKPFIA